MSYIHTYYLQGFIKASEIKTVDLEPRPKRCQMADCKAKLSLTDSPCKCSQIFCMKHRHAELHSCTYDFKGESDARLKKEMNEVRGQKLERI
uniref:AN1-type domain-containing protein n=1 Tax=viral metagenome TaxID=1070528 RepID=A0A6C0K4W0_9ZZZZ